MNKYAFIGLLALVLMVSCSDNVGSGPGEDTASKEYYYRISVPTGFSADVIYFYHEEPNSIQKSTGLIENIQGSYKTDTFAVNPLSRTPFAELRINETRKINYADDIAGQLKAEIYVDGTVVKDTLWQLPAGLGSISLGYKFTQ